MKKCLNPHPIRHETDTLEGMTTGKENLYKLCSEHMAAKPIRRFGLMGSALSPGSRPPPLGHDHFDLRVSADPVNYRNDQHIGSRPQVNLKTRPQNSKHYVRDKI